MAPGDRIIGPCCQNLVRYFQAGAAASTLPNKLHHNDNNVNNNKSVGNYAETVLPSCVPCSNCSAPPGRAAPHRTGPSPPHPIQSHPSPPTRKPPVRWEKEGGRHHPGSSDCPAMSSGRSASRSVKPTTTTQANRKPDQSVSQSCLDGRSVMSGNGHCLPGNQPPGVRNQQVEHKPTERGN